MLRTVLVVAFTGGLLMAGGCATRQPASPASSRPPVVLVPTRLANVEDDRAQFRQLFCALYDKQLQTPSEESSCNDVLVRFGGEPGKGSAYPVASSRPARIQVAVVRGFGWECWQGFINAQLLPTRHLQRLGYKVSEIQVDGLSGSGRNAETIREAVLATADINQGQKLVLMGHSKGVVDILESVVAYPDVAQRVAGVISIAGSVGGSPLADEIPPDFLALVPAIPGMQCEKGDGKALESLRPQIRQRWLATHSLPRSVRYYSLVTAPEPGRVSTAIRPSQRRLGQVDPRNDGALLPQDQVIPGGVLLGYVNADHWAVALPIAESNRLLGSTVVNRNDFPRDTLWEALVRYVEWDLDSRSGQSLVDNPGR